VAAHRGDRGGSGKAVSDEIKPRKTEAPCEVTGVGCNWLIDDGYEEEGIGWDMYCVDCYRFRDWGLDEWEPETEDEESKP